MKDYVLRWNRTVGQEEKLFLECRTWEERAPHIHPQDEPLDAEIDAAHIIIAVVWGRIDSRDLDLDDAISRAFRRKVSAGGPWIVIYRCVRPFDVFARPDGCEQAARVRDFFNSCERSQNVYRFITGDELEQHLAGHVGRMVTTLSQHTASLASEADLPALLQPHLSQMILSTAYVPMPGVSGSEVRQLPLDRVYVRLQFAHHQPSSAQGTHDLRDVLKRRRLALVGPPGAGKTTILKYVSLCLSRHHLGVGGSLSPAELGYEGKVPIPVYWSAQELYDDLLHETGGDLEKATLDTWGRALSLTLARAGVVASSEGADLLRNGGFLLMVDGVDELGGNGNRIALSNAITLLARNLEAAERTQNRLLVTYRTTAWGSGLPMFEEARVLRLGQDAIDDFIRRWSLAAYGVHASSSPSTRRAAEQVADGMLQAIRASKSVQNIATNPQMLTMLAVLYFGTRSLPHQRAKLYQACVDYLVNKRLPLLTRWGGAASVMRHLRALARALHEGQDGDVLLREDAVALLSSLLGPVEEGPTNAAELLHDIEIHVGLLTAHDRHIQFHHRTFQEYLVAFDTADAPEPLIALAPHLDDAGWWEVIALTTGILASRGERLLRRFLEGLTASPGSSLPIRARRAALAAHCLSDLDAWGLPGDVLAPLRGAVEEVLPILDDATQDMMTSISVAESIGVVSDPRLSDPERRWIEVPDGPFLQVPPGAPPLSQERPGTTIFVSTFRIARWLVTIAEYHEFIDDDGYRRRELWMPEAFSWMDEHKIRAPRDWDAQIQKSSNHPVTGVSHLEASAYCTWLSLKVPALPNGWEVRLPTEAEWAKAARGGIELRPGTRNPHPARIYPWGDSDDPRYANSAHHGRLMRTTPVGCFPAGHGPYDTWDQAGNVWEWCLDWYTSNSGAASLRDPCVLDERAAAVVEVTDDDGRSLSARCKVCHGGGWSNVPASLAIPKRTPFVPERRLPNVGFRCAVGRRLPPREPLS